MTIFAPDTKFAAALTSHGLSVLPLLDTDPQNTASTVELLHRRRARRVRLHVPWRLRWNAFQWRGVARILRSARALDTAWVLEHPRSGDAWKQLVIVDICRAGRTVVLDQCAFGSRARRRTGLVSRGVDSSRLACECSGGRMCCSGVPMDTHKPCSRLWLRVSRRPSKANHVPRHRPSLGRGRGGGQAELAGLGLTPQAAR